MNVIEKIESLRREMKKEGVQAYIIPTDDFHGSEYVGDYFKAREFLSGFTGSAGTLVVSGSRAFLWTDGRYFLQAEEQLSGSLIELMRAGQPDVPSIAEFLARELSDGSTVGFDGRTVSNAFIEQIGKKAKECGEKQFIFKGNLDLADRIWENRPAMSREPVWEVDVKYAGLTREEKLEGLREKIQEDGADYLLLTALEEIAWLLNLRGNDVAYTPVFLAYMLISMDSAILCVHEEILSEGIKKKLTQAGVEFMPYTEIENLLIGLPQGKRILADEKSVNYRLIHSIPDGVEIMDEVSPVELMKAVKTPEEMAAMEEAHRKDGVAVTRFIRWLKDHVGKESVTEMSAAEKLLKLRKEMDGFLDQSFAPIVAYGAHGAIVHYGATEETDASLEPSSFCLVDTGGHYLEGTTDITRTIALGTLTEEEKRAYTLVLRGHLSLGKARFPEGVCGQNLDYLARAPLWENGLDFNHGTGHGVGFLLSVHEGPQRFHWRIREEEKVVPLQEGMVISNEPGLYLTGKFGIRLENLVLCKKSQKTEYGQFLYLAPLTMAPFDRAAIEPGLMSDCELAALNEYHERVYKTLAPYMEGEELEWLRDATAEMHK